MVTACAADSGDGSGPARSSSPTVSSDEPTATESPEDPNTPTSWGPTIGEVEQAQQLVSTWSPDQLAGGVIVGRYHGTDPAEPAAMVRELHLAGF
jgi:beta-N-acetylhexosaminidase